jgi:hypothetical protein
VTRKTTAAAALALALLATAPAQAQLGLSAGVGVGATNNNLSIEGAPAEEQGSTSEADGMVRTNLGAHYLLLGRNFSQALDYTLSTFLYIQREQSVSFAHELGWTGLINPTRFSQLDFGLRASHGRTSDMDLFRGQALGGSEARPTRSESFAAFSASENLLWELGPFWEAGQRFNAELYQPIGYARTTTARTLGLEARLTLSRVWIRDQLGLFAEGGHGRSRAVIFDEPMQGLTGYPARRANWQRVGLDYGHAFNDFWIAGADVGVLSVQVPQIRSPFVDVGVNASVTHRTEKRGTLQLLVGRGVDTNVYVGDVLLQNSVGLRAELPLGFKEAWHLTADVEYQRSESLFVIDVKERLSVVAASAIVSYDWTRQARLLFELNFTYQNAEAGLRNTLRSEPFTLHRTMFLASIEMHYPQIEEDEDRGGARRLGGRGGASGLEDEPDGDDRGGPSAETGGGSVGGESGGGESPP